MANRAAHLKHESLKGKGKTKFQINTSTKKAANKAVQLK